MTYGRMIEVQARMLAAFIRGDTPATSASQFATTSGEWRVASGERGSGQAPSPACGAFEPLPTACE